MPPLNTRKSDIGKHGHSSYGVDLRFRLRTQRHFPDTLLIGMEAVDAGDPLHAGIIHTCLSEFVGEEHNILFAALRAVRAQSLVVTHGLDSNPNMHPESR